MSSFRKNVITCVKNMSDYEDNYLSIYDKKVFP